MLNKYHKNRQDLHAKLILYFLADGKRYTTGQMSHCLKVRWDTANNHLNRLFENGMIDKIRHQNHTEWMCKNGK